MSLEDFMPVGSQRTAFESSIEVLKRVKGDGIPPGPVPAMASPYCLHSDPRMWSDDDLKMLKQWVFLVEKCENEDLDQLNTVLSSIWTAWNLASSFEYKGREVSKEQLTTAFMSAEKAIQARWPAFMLSSDVTDRPESIIPLCAKLTKRWKLCSAKVRDDINNPPDRYATGPRRLR